MVIHGVIFYSSNTHLQHIPSSIVQETIEEIIRQFENMVMSVKTLTADPDIDSLTQSEKYEVKTICAT